MLCPSKRQLPINLVGFVKWFASLLRLFCVVLGFVFWWGFCFFFLWVCDQELLILDFSLGKNNLEGSV